MRHMRRHVWKTVTYTVSSGASGVWALTWKISWGWAEVWRAHRWLMREHRGRYKGRQQQTRHPGRGSVCCVSAALKGWCAVVSNRKPAGPCAGRTVRRWCVRAWNTRSDPGADPSEHTWMLAPLTNLAHTVMPEASPETLDDTISGLHSQILHFSRS